MAHTEVNWRSKVLGRETTMQILTPEVGTPPYATLYLLHSLNDDSRGWLRKTSIEQLVRPLPVLVVMPDGDRGFYTDHEDGPAYARHIGEELVDFVDHKFPVRRERGARAIGGVSMGGYGALRVGLGYPDRFCSIHSHAGSLDRHVEFKLNPADRTGIMKNRPDSFIVEMRRIFGERPLGTKHDVLRLAIQAKKRRQLPKLWIDCGVDDYLIVGTRIFHADLVSARISHEYRELLGSHNSEYRAQDLAAAVAFHARHLGIGAMSSAQTS